MHVRAKTTYPLAAASPRVRLAQFVEPLRAHGVQMTVESTLSDDEYATITSDAPRASRARALSRAALRLPRRAHADSPVLIHRLLFLAAVPGIDPPRRVDAYDFDDALFVGSIGRRDFGQRLLKREAGRWRKYVARARLVIAGNEFLASHALRHATGAVEVVPSCVAPEDYDLSPHDDGETVTVGWIGSDSTAPYLTPVLDAVDQLHSSGAIPGIRLVVVGADLGISAPWLVQRKWTLDTVRSDLRGFDIGVMPMPDGAWARGKCGYKLLQYFAAGVPGVVSPVGVARDLSKGGRALTAATAEDWRKQISVLARDAVGRRERGAVCRSFVEAEYSYERWAPELAGALAALA